MNESKDYVLEAIKSLITEEQIDDAIREIVSERMEYAVQTAIREKAEHIADVYCDKKIEEVLAEVYGNKVAKWEASVGDYRAVSFEEYIRDTVKVRCRNQWNMERLIAEMVKKRVEEVCQKVVDDSESELVDKAMKILAGGK